MHYDTIGAASLSGRHADREFFPGRSVPVYLPARPEPANPDPGGRAGLPPAGAAERGPLGGAHPGGAGLHPCGGALARPVGGGPEHPPAGGKPGLSGRLRGQRVHLHPRPCTPALSAGRDQQPHLPPVPLPGVLRLCGAGGGGSGLHLR